MNIYNVELIVKCIEQSNDPDVKDMLKEFLKKTLLNLENPPPTSSPQLLETRPGCKVCGVGSEEGVIGYVCYRTDCPTKASFL